jgi:ABC-2 type transport system permease protein
VETGTIRRRGNAFGVLYLVVWFIRETVNMGERGAAIYDSAARQRPFWQAIFDIYRYRGLVRLLVRRELTVRYKRSLLGVSWTVLNPVLTSLVMWFVFNALFHPFIGSRLPFIIYLFSGVLVVIYFQQGVIMSGSSMTASAGILTKVYVPPVLFAVASSCAGAVNFLIGLVPLMIFQIAFGVGVPWTILLVPVPLLFLLMLVTGVGLVVASFAVQYADILDLTAVFVFLLGYLTPTFYPLSIIPVTYRHFIFLNPLASYVQVFRFLEYAGPTPTWNEAAAVIVSGVIGLSIGLKIFVVRWPRLCALL